MTSWKDAMSIGTSGLYILDENRNIVPVATTKEWGEYMSWGNKWKEHCQVGLYQGPEGSVSTVFLGMDHSVSGPPPMLFETMSEGDIVERYSTWALAEQGHQRYVEKLKEAYNGATNDGTSS